MKRFLGMLLIALYIGSLGLSLGLSSDNASAASIYDNAVKQTYSLSGSSPHASCQAIDLTDNLYSNLADYDNWYLPTNQNDINILLDKLDQRIDENNYAIKVIENSSGGWSNLSIRIIFPTDDGETLYLTWDDIDSTSIHPTNGMLSFITLLCNSSVNYKWGGAITGAAPYEPMNTNSSSYFVFKGDTNYPVDYEGVLINEHYPSYSNWTPNIKLHQGSDWEVELSDYNFFTFDKVAFTCGEHELAPVINWEVWDITDDPNRVLIDTLIFGAPALVTYNAPKIQEDKRYEIVAYYSDCEGYNFTEASTKQFTVRRDGTLNPPDYMVVCIREDFPYINVPDCWAEVNDFLTILTFRTPNVDDVGGGVFSNLVDGCRELQVIDTWIFAPNQQICPQIPSNIRSIVTPFITFALGLMAATFIAKQQGIRGIN